MIRTKAFEEGGYVYIDSEVIKGWHKCGAKEYFANHEPYNKELEGKEVKWVGSPLDKELMGDVLALISHYPRTEVMICLYYNTKENKWLPHVPKQKGSPAHVDYNDEDYTPPADYMFMGTIHTHPNMSAFWSGTDSNDQGKKNGLHVVIGTRDGKYNQHLCSVFYNGERYDQKDCVELPDLENLPEAKKEWLDLVEEDFTPVPEIKVDDAKWTSKSWSYDNLDWHKDPYSEMFGDYDNIYTGYNGNISYNTYENEEDMLEEATLIAQELSPDSKYELVQTILEMLGEEDLCNTVGESRSDQRELEEQEASDSSDFEVYSSTAAEEPEDFELKEPANV